MARAPGSGRIALELARPRLRHEDRGDAPAPRAHVGAGTKRSLSHRMRVPRRSGEGEGRGRRSTAKAKERERSSGGEPRGSAIEPRTQRTPARRRRSCVATGAPRVATYRPAFERPSKSHAPRIDKAPESRSILHPEDCAASINFDKTLDFVRFCDLSNVSIGVRDPNSLDVALVSPVRLVRVRARLA